MAGALPAIFLEPGRLKLLSAEDAVVLIESGNLSAEDAEDAELFWRITSKLRWAVAVACSRSDRD
jgi:hypothetical protein